MNAVLISLLLLLSSVSAENWKRYLRLDPNYEVWWSMYDDSITFQVEVATTGWVGFGVSPNGGMAGSDIVIGWVDNNDTIFHDRYAEGKFLPEIDEQQDWELLWHQKNDTHTKFRVKRLLDTCDEQDMEITEATTRLIFAYNSEKPNSIDSVPYHGPTSRGTKSVYLKQEVQHRFTEKPEELLHWDVKIPNVTIPEEGSTDYLCTFVRIPFLNRKHHIIEFEPLIQPGNEDLVHHVVLFECTGATNESIAKYNDKKYHTCYTKDKVPKFPFCLTFHITWAIGGQKFYFPENVGLPIGPPESEWFLLEVHYDNLKLRKAIDNSGLRITYTPKLRKYDSAILCMGNLWYPCMFVPPKQKEFIMSGHVSPSCLNQRIPPDGIKAFGAMAHSHLLGKRMNLRHYRGNEELEPLVSDNNYDLNLQQNIRFSKIRTILPNDHLIHECTYDSSKRSRVTFGGLSTLDEMCVTFILYYPRQNLGFAGSCPLPNNVLTSLGVKEVFENDKYLISPFTGKNESYFKFLYNYPWNEKSIGVARKAMKYSPQINICIDRGWKLVPTFVLSTYPKVQKGYEKPRNCSLKRKKPKPLGSKNVQILDGNSEIEDEFEDVNIDEWSSFNGSVLPYEMLDNFYLK